MIIYPTASKIRLLTGATTAPSPALRSMATGASLDSIRIGVCSTSRVQGVTAGVIDAARRAARTGGRASSRASAWFLFSQSLRFIAASCSMLHDWAYYNPPDRVCNDLKRSISAPDRPAIQLKRPRSGVPCPRSPGRVPGFSRSSDASVGMPHAVAAKCIATASNVRVRTCRPSNSQSSVVFATPAPGLL